MHPQEGSGKTKVEVRDKLRELHKETDAGLRPRRFYTVSDALEDWHATDYVDGGELWVLRGVLSNPHWAATLTWSFDVRECGILTARWDSS